MAWPTPRAARARCCTDRLTVPNEGRAALGAALVHGWDRASGSAAAVGAPQGVLQLLGDALAGALCVMVALLQRAGGADDVRHALAGVCGRAGVRGGGTRR